MKTIQIISLVLVCFASSVFAQDNPFVVDVAPRITNGDTQISFVAMIPDADLSTIENKWLRYTAKSSRGKSTFANGIYRQTGVLNPEVSTKPFDVNSQIVYKNNGVQLTVWMDQDGAPFRGDGSRNNGDLAVQNYVRDFAVREYRLVLNNKLTNAQSKQRMLERDYAHLRKTNKLSAVDSATYAGDSSKKSKHHKKSKLSAGSNDRIHEQLAFKVTEIESQKKIVSDTKVKLVEVR